MVNWSMCNVVWYDGQDAFVSKHILRTITDGIVLDVTDESRKLVEEEICGNGEVLKIDILSPVDFDNIEALKGYEKSDRPYEQEYYRAYLRFKDMWF